MPNRLYTDEMKEYMKEIVPGRRTPEITEMMNDKFNTQLKDSQIENLKGRLRLKNGLPTNEKGARRLFTKEQERFIRGHAKGRLTKELTELLNETFNTNFKESQVETFKTHRKIRSFIDAKFKKGQKAFNEGLKQEDYLTDEQIERTKGTRFKKGEKPVNVSPIGTEIIDDDGYIRVKVRDDQKLKRKNWRLKAQVILEKHNGPVADGKVIIYLDRDKSNLNIDNLAVIKRADLARLNQSQLWTNDMELNKTAVSIARLKTKAGELRRS